MCGLMMKLKVRLRGKSAWEDASNVWTCNEAQSLFQRKVFNVWAYDEAQSPHIENILLKRTFSFITSSHIVSAL